MIKKLSFLCFALLATLGTVSAANEVKVLQESTTEIHLQVATDSYSFSTVQWNGENWQHVLIPGGSKMLQAGAPELPKWSESVLISDLSSWELSIYDAHYIELTPINLLPSKGNLSRNINPASVEYQLGAEYQNNAFYPGDLASLSEPYIIRDARGIAIQLQPFQYNPVTKVLRIYTDYKIKMVQNAAAIVNPILQSSTHGRGNAEFNEIYQRQFINFPQGKYNSVAEQGEMLVICHPNFMEVVEPLVSWKIQKGIQTTMVDVTTIGNAAAIKTYIANFYNTHNLTWVLLVGDAAFVPSSTTSAGDSDNDYSFIAGSDHYPDIFVGRFSAETVAHARTMVDRALAYEVTPMVSNHYEHIIGIGSSQGPGDDNEMDYQHVRNMQTDALSFTYSSASEFFDGSQGGLDAAGDPTAAAVASQLNNGSGLLVYTGHGSNTSFSSSGLSNTQVSALTNTGKWPFVWAVACVNGNFVGTTCFAEAWTRASYNNQPTGAIATLMSTINQSWDPPMCGQDEMVDILTESYTNNIRRSFGGISMNGCMQMNDEYGTGGYSMTDTWTCFGDPSVMVRTATPQTMSATHLPATFIGMSSFTVNCSQNGALAALTLGNTILGTALVQNGMAVINHSVLNNVGSMTLTITGFNYIPYIAAIDIIPNEGPFVTLNGYGINDLTGNQNTVADFGETIQLDFNLFNVGIQQASHVLGTLTTNDPFITILTNQYNFGDIDSAAAINPVGVFSIQIANNVEDQHLAPFTLTLIDDSSNTWTCYFNLILNAPALSIILNQIEEANPSNNNGQIDAGENFILNFTASNLGHATVNQADITLQSSSAFITIPSASTSLGILNPGDSQNVSFACQALSTTPFKELADFEINMISGAYTSSASHTEEINKITEDWESAGFTHYTWAQSGTVPWTIIQSAPYQGGYSAKSGDINSSQSSTLSVTIDVLEDGSLSFYKKVSCEEAQGTSYWDYLEFFIDGVSKGKWAGELAWSQESFAVTTGSHTLKWTYQKDSYLDAGSDCAWIDYIEFPLINANVAPFFTTTVDTLHIPTNQAFSFDIEAFDPNLADILSFEADSLLPSFALNSSGNLQVTLTANPTDELIGYHVMTLTASDGMTYATKQLVLHIYNLISTEDFNQALATVYPNPANSIITIQLNQPDGLIILYASSGELLHTQRITGKTAQLDLERYSNGVYLIHIQAGTISTWEKLILQK